MRLRVIKDAKKTLILSTFDFRSDDAGKDILAALLNAADRGVKVEIFADGFNSIIQMENNDYFYALSSNGNVKIIIYNQVNILTPWNGWVECTTKYVIADDSRIYLADEIHLVIFLVIMQATRIMTEMYLFTIQAQRTVQFIRLKIIIRK